MKDQTRDALLSLGMNIDQTLARFVGNEALLFKFLRKFTQDGTYVQLEAAIRSGDKEEGFRAAHTLKGVAGNLGLDGLFNSVSPLVEALRSSDTSGVDAMFETVKAQYELAFSTIQSLDNP